MLSVSVLVQIDLAEFDSVIAVVKKQLFTENVPKQQYMKLQQVRFLKEGAEYISVTVWCHDGCRDVRCHGVVQENVRLAAECKEAQELAADRLAILEEFKALSGKI